MAHVDHYRNGKRLVSVTELQSVISKPFLDKWKQGLCECKGCKPSGDGFCGFIKAKKVAEEAAALGTKVHEEVERYLKAQEVNAETSWTEKIIAVYKQNNVIPYLLAPEDTLIDYESGLAGSPDAVVTWNGEPCITDLKIKNSLDALTGMQGLGYRYLIRRKHGVDIPLMRVIWCQKKNVSQSVKVVPIDLREWEKPWKHLVEVWNIVNPSRKVLIHD